jgi:periplasmic protein TonB
MAEHQMSGSDPSKPLPSSPGALRDHPDDPKFNTDFADLAARFSTLAGGGLSPESSADLALEIVLNEIVEQACLATGATGAAIVLEREEAMVCRATSGATAPELGSQLDMTTGLAGECANTRRTQWCDDTSSDLRADVEKVARLGVRSIVMMPLMRDEKLLGVIELFSTQPYAFGVRDERTLEVLADRTVKNLEHAAHSHEQPMTQEAVVPSGLPAGTDFPDDMPWQKDVPAFQASATPIPPLEPFLERFPQRPVRRKSDTVTSLLYASVLVCAVLVGLVVGRQWGSKHAGQRTRPALTTSVSAAAPVKPAGAVTPAPSGNNAGSNALSSSASSSNPSSMSRATSSSLPSRPAPQSAPASAPIQKAQEEAAKPARPAGKSATQSAEAQVPPGGLSVFENGREVFRMPPSGPPKTIVDQRPAESPMKQAAAIESEPVELSPDAAEDSLQQRIEPDYPEAARKQNVQGAVVLNLQIGADGSVEDVHAQSGPPLLAQAAIDAVKQWKFQPHTVDGHAVRTRTTTTLNFILPKQ